MPIEPINPETMAAPKDTHTPLASAATTKPFT